MARNEWPEGWEVRRLGDIVLPTETRDPRKTAEAVFKYVDISSVDNAAFRITGYKEYRGKDAPSRARKVIRTDDVLFATTRPYLRSVAIVPMELDGEICSTGFCVLRSNGIADPQWLFALARSDIVVDPVVKTMRGANYPAVTDRDVLAVEIPLPPLGEQQRIVARIEELTRRIEEARGLRQAARQEAASILPAALAEAFGRADKNEWGTKRLNADALCRVIPGQHVMSGEYTYEPLGTPYITGPADFGIKFPVVTKWTQVPKAFAEPGDVLLTVKGAGVGKVNCAPDTKLAIGRQVMALRPDSSRLHRDFLYAFLMYRFDYFQGIAQSATVLGIRRGQVESLEIPLPPLIEQRRIVAYLDGLQARVEALRRLQEETEAEIAAMSGAVLAKAFRGEL
jgi:type I restriction enzyme S subunit